MVPESRIGLLKALSVEVATLLGKPEDYVMTAWLPETRMTFAGKTTPTAFIELDSIGLTTEQARQLSKALCTLIAEQTEIQSDRIYIRFYDAPRALWGWNGGTFE